MSEFSFQYRGDSVTGTVESIGAGYAIDLTPDPYPILTLSTGRETVVVNATNEGLRHALTAAGVEVGQLVTITFTGVRKINSAGFRRNEYQVVVT
ncbi:hypothetical protein ACIGG9_24880 [Pseudonocardia alni]|uniref:hypothetical protein n=1 Tax=Pseudonocardia alni TaxID=33907 RepID=UPI00340C2EC9